MKHLLFLFFIILAYTSHSQETVAINNSVVVHKDARIDMLIKKQANINTAVKKSKCQNGKGIQTFGDQYK